MVIGGKVISGGTSGAKTIESKRILLDTLTGGAMKGNTISPNNLTGDIIEPKVLNGKVIGGNLLSSNSPATDLENAVSEGAKSLTIDEVPEEIRGLWQGKVNPKGTWQGITNPNLGLLLGIAAPGLGALAAYGILKGLSSHNHKKNMELAKAYGESAKSGRD